MPEMTNEAIRTVKWVEWVLAPIIVLAIITLGKCTASAQDELITLQKDVSQITKVNGETKEAIKQIEKDLTDIKVNNGKIEANQEHFKEQISKMQLTQEETNRLLRGISR